jgi:ATP-dependent Lon protease
MNRKFIRISLGGIHDEAEIRGHRRTYIGAMPGKIITEIKRCGSANPVFMLDEIDKVGKDFRGDPSSALLEVLDPEQNHAFMDNFVNLPYDLSKCFFITTANTLDTIPPALADRMEIIEFRSYIDEEKIQIAKKYLIPKELEINGLSSKHILFQTNAISEIIRYYVREAGVRSLQRNIASVMRKVARRVAEQPNSATDFKKTIVTDINVKDFLGRRKFLQEMVGRADEIGIATGLAWTNFGGEILFCESTRMAGKGQLLLTGSLGEVMIESAKLALSYIKANAKKYNIEPNQFENFDIHIHVPAGAVPKDGPSAGITLTISLISLLTQKKARHDIAMTGEITLFGKILNVGGISEKVLAARRAGIATVILPTEASDSFDEIPADVRAGIDVVYVDHIDDVIQLVISE